MWLQEKTVSEMGHLRGYGHRRVPYAWIWLGQCFDLIMLCYHEYVVRSWIGYVIVVYDKLFDYIMLLLLCCVILFYVYPVIRGFLLSLGSRVCG